MYINYLLQPIIILIIIIAYFLLSIFLKILVSKNQDNEVPSPTEIKGIHFLKEILKDLPKLVAIYLHSHEENCFRVHSTEGFLNDDKE